MSAAPWTACKNAFIQDALHDKPSTSQWSHEHRAWQADYHQVIFSNESYFNLWDYIGRARLRHYAIERCLPECVIERHNGRIPGVMVSSAILYHGRSGVLRIGDNLNCNRYVCKVLQPIDCLSLPSRHHWNYFSAG